MKDIKEVAKEWMIEKAKRKGIDLKPHQIKVRITKHNPVAQISFELHDAVDFHTLDQFARIQALIKP